MSYGAMSERIRNHAITRYILPAKNKGQTRVSIAVRDLMKELEAQNFPAHHQAQFCTAMKTEPFLKENGLVIERIDGPPSKKSTTVVFHYRIDPLNDRATGQDSIRPNVVLETSSERAFRLTEKLRGLMKDEIASFGGTEAFMRWVRADEDEE